MPSARILWCRLYWDAANNKPAANTAHGSTLTLKHPYNVGYDFNHESPSTKRYVNAGTEVTGWTEYQNRRLQIRPYPKDLPRTNNPNDVGKWGQYDASRIAIIKGICRSDQVCKSPDALMSSWSISPTMRKKRNLSDYGCMLWGNITHGYQEAVMGFSSNFSGGYFKNRGWNQPGLSVIYGEPR
jgi:hypothetical protein